MITSTSIKQWKKYLSLFSDSGAPTCRECYSNLGKVNQPKCLKTGNQVFTSPSDIAEAFNNHFTNIGQPLAQEIPSSEIDPLAYVNMLILLTEYFLINGLIFKKSSNY